MPKRTKQPTNQELLDTINSLNTSLSDRIDDVNANLLGTINAVNTSLLGKINDTNTNLSNRVDDVNTTLLEAIHGLAAHTDERFQAVDKRFEQHELRFDDITNTLDYLVSTTIRIHEDHLAAIEWLKRHEIAIQALKLKAGLA